MSDPTPTDYDASDGWDDGVEICPHCETVMGTESGYHGPVVDYDGRRYDHLLDTEPGEGPYFCPDCWDELETNRREKENESLGMFT